MSDKTIYDVRHPIDKKVIVVGNSTSILKKEYGEIIDSYDIVIRVNRCITQGYEKYIGKKIDIWATTRTDSIKSRKSTKSKGSRSSSKRIVNTILEL